MPKRKKLEITLSTHLNPSARSRKGKRTPLNMNWYQTAHSRQTSAAKKRWSQLIGPTLPKVFFEGKIKATYTFYNGDKRLTDVNNWCAVLDKFLMDVLVSNGIILEDDYRYVVDTRFKYGCYDKNNQRVEVVIEELKE